MLEAQLNNLNQDIAVLQHYISRGKDIGFSNMARLLEALTIAVFKRADIADLHSTNQIKVNFPAIDAADDSGDGIAVQVTSNANAAKVKKTIAAFEKKDASGASLSDKYAKLYIFGFCNHTQQAEVPAYCEVIGPDFLLNRLTTLNDEKRVAAVADAIHQHVDYSSIHPYTDIDCLKIVLGYISRPAVRHRMASEGNVDDMTLGLTEIQELIGKGTVNGRPRSKAHHEFLDAGIQEFLLRVMDHIAKIKAIVNKRLRTGDKWVCLNGKEDADIDELKNAIVSDAQRMAALHGIPMPMAMLP